MRNNIFDCITANKVISEATNPSNHNNVLNLNMINVSHDLYNCVIMSTVLVININVITVINDAITELKLCLKDDIKQIEDSFKLKLNEATLSADEAKGSSNMKTIAIREIRSEMDILKKECLVVKRENEEFKKKHSNDMETYSRKNNIIFNGITEVSDETNELCESAVRAFLRNTLQIEGAV